MEKKEKKSRYEKEDDDGEDEKEEIEESEGDIKTNLTRKKTRRGRRDSDEIEIEVESPKYHGRKSTFVPVRDQETQRDQAQSPNNSFQNSHSSNLQRSIHDPHLVQASSNLQVSNSQIHNPNLQVPAPNPQVQVPNLQVPAFPNPQVPNPLVQVLDPRIPDQQANIIQINNQNTPSSAINSLFFFLKIMLITIFIVCFLIIIHDGGFDKGPVTASIIVLTFINFMLILTFMFDNCNHK